MSAITSKVIDARYPAETFIAGRASVTELVDQAVELAHHDMPVDLFNEVAALLLSHPDPKALFAVERLRSRYGASTRRALGLGS